MPCQLDQLAPNITQRKTGRTVSHLIFTFAPKEAPPAEVPREPPNADGLCESELFKRLRRHGIGVRLALTWLRQDEGRVRATLDSVEARARQGRIKGSVAGYLRTLFEGGAEIGPSAFEAEQQAQAHEEAQAKRRTAAQRRAQETTEQEARAAVLALSPETRRALARDYRQGAGAAASASWDEARGEFRDALERMRFNRWLHQRVSDRPSGTGAP